ncbi:uncharacterized protein MYCGRDRAFT_98043 [Zymoseptoria tritici IPO323]|uniref:Uncharacterized protein n=1 Tax=Zymoseptoria tritici (strain CBS 115943 / IPO323) TaxID=336722 RepID=F9XS53_ZYMTI|nr:uncharacterized protein MYCGRDRAFT_98043 [Zymoseptoria tritici IPO323]EGP81906.1 hypothetical protein MYCGRDRAFT_98043 [Zymoseptoria tritici IPO323]
MPRDCIPTFALANSRVREQADEVEEIQLRPGRTVNSSIACIGRVRELFHGAVDVGIRFEYVFDPGSETADFVPAKDIVNASEWQAAVVFYEFVVLVDEILEKVLSCRCGEVKDGGRRRRGRKEQRVAR